MTRMFVAAVLLVSVAKAAEPPDPVTRAVGVQKAVYDARQALSAGKPAAAAAALEAQLPNADGSAEFLAILGRAYDAELKQLRAAAQPDEKRIREVTARLAALGQAPEATPAPAAVPVSGTGSPLSATVSVATGLFNQADFPAAAKMFEKAFLGKVELRPDQLAAWAYCRVKVAAEQLNRSPTDADVAKAVEAEVTDALALAPTNDGLQKAGGEVIAAARKRQGKNPLSPTRVAAIPAGWEVVESANFRIRHRGTKDVAEAVAKVAEQKRVDIFTRWSGPPRGAWGAKCEVILHPSQEMFTESTKLPAGATGLATVRLDDGAVAERKIDLRADDATAAADAFPRELTHVILADLFPTQAPPKWAEVGMAVLACSSDEVVRFDKAATTAARTQDLFAVADLAGLAGFPPAEKVTGFYASAVTLVEYLVKLKGERAFTTFLRDSQRYGMEAAFRRNYATDARQLDSSWRQSVLAGR